MSDEDLIDAIRAASGYALHREAARRVLDVVRPSGWRVVPEEATWVMSSEGGRYVGSRPQARSCYCAMIAVAPSPPLPSKTRDDDPMKETFA